MRWKSVDKGTRCGYVVGMSEMNLTNQPGYGKLRVGKGEKPKLFLDGKLLGENSKNKEVHGYFLMVNGKAINEKPLTWTSAVLNYCRMGTMRKPRKKVKNRKLTQYYLDHSGLKIKPNFV